MQRDSRILKLTLLLDESIKKNRLRIETARHAAKPTAILSFSLAIFMQKLWIVMKNTKHFAIYFNKVQKYVKHALYVFIF